eukprot:scaffold96221_cov30-Phaeocystis_antarctica.AAC.1
MPARVTPSRRCSGSVASLSSCAGRLAVCTGLCMTRLTRSMTGSGAATSRARPPSRDESLYSESLCSESLCSLLPQHPISRDDVFDLGLELF